MSAAAKLLGRLQHVSPCGTGAWLACCPGHDDSSPSLSIRETSDGTLLVHCFAGCHTGTILKAIGLDLRDLFPRAVKDRVPPRHRGAHYHAAREALRVLQRDALLVAIAAGDLAAGRVLDGHDIQTLFAVAGRTRRIAELVL